MCPKNLYFIFLMLLTLTGCSTLSVSSDYDAAVDFGSWHTYRWQQAPDTTAFRDLLASNPLHYRRVRGAVDRELATKGYLLREKGPVDFTVSAKGIVRLLARLDPAPVSWNVGYYRGRPRWSRFWWGGQWPTYTYYEEGTLLLDLNDAGRNELAWRGAVSGLFRDFRSPEQMQAEIDVAVRKLLSIFPPVRK
ncbi:MAG: DUF4136 domain-containing protein [Chlorobiaceae bacterium]|nr:DUF4136 domain-containing protein [Chlorobiaceae bacterium]